MHVLALMIPPHLIYIQTFCRGTTARQPAGKQETAGEKASFFKMLPRQSVFDFFSLPLPATPLNLLAWLQKEKHLSSRLSLGNQLLISFLLLYRGLVSI
jgi:hypothetical protein